MYVDDWLIRANSNEKAFSLFKHAKAIMSEASFNFAKWVSNIFWKP